MINEQVSTDFLNLIVDRLAEKLKPEIIEKLSSFSLAPDDKTMDVEEAAAYMKISKELLYRMCAEGSIPHIRLGSDGARRKRILLSSASIDKWKREQEMLNYYQKGAMK